MNPVHLEKAVALRHELHAHPALSLEEAPTMARLIAFLREHTTLEIVERGAWFYALYRAGEGAESIAFRADMDALPMAEEPDLPYASQTPGVSHRCGHDGHCAALALLAMEIDEQGSEKNVYFIFQHAEEIGAGGRVCAALIREAGISRVYAFHNWSGFPQSGVVLIHGVAQCASMGYTVLLHGRAAHAGQPGDGANPSEALARLLLALPGIHGAADYRGHIWLTVVGFGAGGRNFGMAAAEGYLAMTLRAEYEEDLRAMQEKIHALAAELAEEYGLGLDTEEQDVFPTTANDEEELRRVRAAAEELGLPIIERRDPILPSEDFGYYLKECPGALVYVGNGEDYPAIHTACYDFNDAILPAVTELFLRLAGGACGSGADSCPAPKLT